MKRHIAISLATVLAVLTVVTLSPELKAQQSSTGQGTLSGTITKVDSVGMKVTVKDAANKEETITLDSSTKITRDGKTAKVGDLKEGDSVKVSRSGTHVTSLEATAKKTS